MKVYTTYRCDNCDKQITVQGEGLPETWEWIIFKGDYCSTCARIEKQRVKNLSQKELRRELEAFPMSQLRKLRVK
jgi:hypothetical protein